MRARLHPGLRLNATVSALQVLLYTASALLGVVRRCVHSLGLVGSDRAADYLYLRAVPMALHHTRGSGLTN